MARVTIHTEPFGALSYSVRPDHAPEFVRWLLRRPWAGLIRVEFGGGRA